MSLKSRIYFIFNNPSIDITFSLEILDLYLDIKPAVKEVDSHVQLFQTHLSVPHTFISFLMIELTCFKIKMKKAEFYFLSLATFQVLNATCYGYVMLSCHIRVHPSDVPMLCVCVCIMVMVL